jgi:hypothetical protein
MDRGGAGLGGHSGEACHHSRESPTPLVLRPTYRAASLAGEAPKAVGSWTMSVVVGPHLLEYRRPGILPMPIAERLLPTLLPAICVACNLRSIPAGAPNPELPSLISRPGAVASPSRRCNNVGILEEEIVSPADGVDTAKGCMNAISMVSGLGCVGNSCLRRFGFMCLGNSTSRETSPGRRCHGPHCRWTPRRRNSPPPHRRKQVH